MIPPNGYVRIVRDDCSPLHAIKCAMPCGGAKGCTAMCDAQGRPPGDPKHKGGVCWLGSAGTYQRAAAYAEQLGYRVIGDAGL